MVQQIYNPADNRQVMTVVNQIASQFEGNTGSVTLGTSTTTIVSNAKCRSTSRIFLQARSASAVTANAYISAITNGSFTITHASGSGRVFDYVLFDI